MRKRRRVDNLSAERDCGGEKSHQNDKKNSKSRRNNTSERHCGREREGGGKIANMAAYPAQPK